jgi:hypothetical protein
MNDDWKDNLAGLAVSATICTVMGVIALIFIHLPRSH